MSVHEQPLVSAVTPMYNREDFLAECFESVLGQTYENLNILVLTTAAQMEELRGCCDEIDKSFYCA